MQVQFREVNPFDLWVWVQFADFPGEMERQYLEEVFNAWYLLGKLGGFNAENLQIQEQGADLSYAPYDSDSAGRCLTALMHNMGEWEYQGRWGRCWFDLGTSDALAVDVLINTLTRLDQEYVEMDTLIIGGENADWPVDRSDATSDLSPEDLLWN
ncbi:MAG: DUF3531 family protein [Gloeomargaritaceae cyanobacterium C42_A2020_066]|nr:DUF3531 family protein [Gloeomargaritaceae cyanobacterium C42_A2020_066]